MGGLGIPIAIMSSETAFISSVGSSWRIQPNIIPRKFGTPVFDQDRILVHLPL
jgi:hypothetical protein